ARPPAAPAPRPGAARAVRRAPPRRRPPPRPRLSPSPLRSRGLRRLQAQCALKAAWDQTSGDLVGGKGELGVGGMALSQIGERGGVVACKAGVAILRGGVVPAREPHC